MDRMNLVLAAAGAATPLVAAAFNHEAAPTWAHTAIAAVQPASDDWNRDDPATRPTRPTTGDRTTSGTASPEDRRTIGDRARDAWDSTERAFRDMWAGVRGENDDLDENQANARLSELEGRFHIEATLFGEDGQPMSQLEGFAERRFILNGTLLRESYALADSRDALMQEFSRRNAPDNIERDPMGRGPNEPREIGADGATTAPPTERPIDRPAGEPGSEPADGAIDRPADRRAGDPTSPRMGGQGVRGADQMSSRIQHGLTLWGYDPGEEEFQTVWSDTETSGMKFATGEYNTEENTFEFEGEYEDPQTGEKFDTRIVLKINDDATQTLTLFRDEGILGQEHKFYEITYTPADNAARDMHRPGTDRPGMTRPGADRPGMDRPGTRPTDGDTNRDRGARPGSAPGG